MSYPEYTTAFSSKGSLGIPRHPSGEPPTTRRHAHNFTGPFSIMGPVFKTTEEFRLQLDLKNMADSRWKFVNK